MLIRKNKSDIIIYEDIRFYSNKEKFMDRIVNWTDRRSDFY